MSRCFFDGFLVGFFGWFTWDIHTRKNVGMESFFRTEKRGCGKEEKEKNKTYVHGLQGGTLPRTQAWYLWIVSGQEDQRQVVMLQSGDDVRPHEPNLRKDAVAIARRRPCFLVVQWGEGHWFEQHPLLAVLQQSIVRRHASIVGLIAKAISHHVRQVHDDSVRPGAVVGSIEGAVEGVTLESRCNGSLIHKRNVDFLPQSDPVRRLPEAARSGRCLLRSDEDVRSQQMALEVDARDGYLNLLEEAQDDSRREEILVHDRRLVPEYRDQMGEAFLMILI